MLLDLDRATGLTWYADSLTEYHTSPRRYELWRAARYWYVRDDDARRQHRFAAAMSPADLPDAVAEVLRSWQAEDSDRKPRGTAADGVIALPGVAR